MKPPYSVLVTSLPRTGTTSMCNMLDRLGFKAKHTPFFDITTLLAPGTAFGDTPCFVPEIMTWSMTQENIPVRHIYLDRDFESWYYSMTHNTKLLKTNYKFQMTPDEDLNESQLCDKKSYGAIFGNKKPADPDFKDYIKICFETQREEALKWNPLVYNFNDGWKTLCDFLELNIPDNASIPHLHKKSIGTKDEK